MQTNSNPAHPGPIAAAAVRASLQSEIDGRAWLMSSAEVERLRSREWTDQRGAIPTDTTSLQLTEEQAAAVLFGLERRGDTVAVPLIGPYTHRPTFLSFMFGLPDLVSYRRALAAIEFDDSIRRVLLLYDTPGGTVAGTVNAAADIERLGETRETVAVVDELAASGGLWLCTAAQEVVLASANTITGSAGVVYARTDITRALEREGVERRYITSGDRKGDAYPDNRLTVEEVAAHEERVARMAQTFLEAIANQRGMSIEEATAKFGDAGLYVGEQAVDLGLADRVASLESVWSAGESGAMTQGVELVSNVKIVIGDGQPIRVEEGVATVRPLTAEEFMANNPDAYAGLVKAAEEKAHKAATELQSAAVAEANNAAWREARGQLEALAAAFEGRPELAVGAFLAGQTVEAAKAAAFDTVQEQLQAKEEALAESQEQLALAKQKRPAFRASDAGTANGRSGEGSKEGGAEEPDEVETACQAAWEANQDQCREEFGGDFAAFVGYERGVRAGTIARR